MEEQRLLVVRGHQEGMSITELAEIHEVSRKTIYKWLERFEEQGLEGLRDRSRRPHESPSQVSGEVEAAIVAARQRWKWGPGKLRVKLSQQDGTQQWPAVSTIAAVLKAKGLVVNRRQRAHSPVQRPPYAAADGPNAVWCADYKGWFRSGDGTRIDPLTITDACSRYLLRCQIVERPRYEATQAVFEAAFREYGLPQVIHTDNGVPFSSVAPGGLSRLSMWFVRLGIVPERSRPACPQDNGRHNTCIARSNRRRRSRRKRPLVCNKKHFMSFNFNTTNKDRTKPWTITHPRTATQPVHAAIRDACQRWSTVMTWRSGACLNTGVCDGEESAPSSVKCSLTNHWV